MPCRADTFRTRNLAARRAWLIRQQGRNAEPEHCDGPDGCGGWHITASPRTTTTPTATSHGDN